ncbi:MAG TPA: CPBP family glutamic-type intramembrane protease [Phycisphaerae bacterium]|nr:CPBP family intramembrane metalloprotease [Phycisphaerales bacterium]HRX84879.1 CPBP family glutamic-type intramembrane protease [Phycisphaerae bacterium]
MPDSPDSASPATLSANPLRRRLDAWVARSPEVAYIAPFMSFLILMALGNWIFPGKAGVPWSYTLRTFGALAVALAFWRYWPPLGKAYLPSAIVFGLLTTVMWVGVHKWFAAQGWYPPTQILGHDAPPADHYDCFAQLGTGWALWLFLIVRIGGASIVVPIVEEIFWRGWVLRVLVDYWKWERVPLGMYTLRSFVLCSVASALEHPMWEVGILCWAVWNLLFYWKKSLRVMMIMHGVTNFALYAYVVYAKDWVFWS